MVDRNKVGEICIKHRLQPRDDALGAYWVHPDFEDTLMIGLYDNGNWADRTPEQPGDFEKAIRTTLDNTSLADLDRYLAAMVEMLRSGQKPPQQASRPLAAGGDADSDDGNESVTKLPRCCWQPENGSRALAATAARAAKLR